MNEKYNFNKDWLNLALEYKNNSDVTFDLSQNDIRVLLTYIEILQSKIDKAIEYIEENGYNVSNNILLDILKEVEENE